VPRKRRPESAAEEILKMVTGGQAKNAADAVRQRPSLEPGLSYLKDAICDTPTTPTADANPKKKRGLRAATSGSGPALLSR
jgi:hypothetical protein